MSTRRYFFKQSAFTAAAIGLGVSPLGAQRSHRWNADSHGTHLEGSPFTGMDAPTLRELALRGVDAARRGGAQFADVRITDRRYRGTSGRSFQDGQHVAVGVRVLVDGFWGFSGSPYWRPDEMDRLAADAIDQAQGNNWGPENSISLAPVDEVASGAWSTPTTRDALAMHPQEINDFLESLSGTTRQERRDAGVQVSADFTRKDSVYASTEGAYATQRLYTAYGSVKVTSNSASMWSHIFGPTGGSYDVLTGLPILDHEVPRLVEHIIRSRSSQPVDVGRYDIVFDAEAMAAIVGQTIGIATEIDRVRGFEANAGGTSYLSPIADVLAGAPIATPLLSVRANRTAPRGAATVRWDDDGAATREFDLVREGRLVDYATSREHVSTMSEWYKTRGMPAVSYGCGYSEHAMGFPLVGVPNLVMQPGKEERSFDDLIADTKNGLAVLGGSVSMDHQQATGQGRGLLTYRIRNGKLDHGVTGAAYLFRSAELWKNLVAIGGAASQQTRGFFAQKGQPNQSMSFSVTAVPARITELAVVNILSK